MRTVYGVVERHLKGIMWELSTLDMVPEDISKELDYLPDIKEEWEWFCVKQNT